MLTAAHARATTLEANQLPPAPPPSPQFYQNFGVATSAKIPPPRVHIVHKVTENSPSRRYVSRSIGRSRAPWASRQQMWHFQFFCPFCRFRTFRGWVCNRGSFRNSSGAVMLQPLFRISLFDQLIFPLILVSYSLPYDRSVKFWLASKWHTFWNIESSQLKCWLTRARRAEIWAVLLVEKCKFDTSPSNFLEREKLCMIDVIHKKLRCKWSQ